MTEETSLFCSTAINRFIIHEFESLSEPDYAIASTTTCGNEFYKDNYKLFWVFFFFKYYFLVLILNPLVLTSAGLHT